MSFPKRCLFVMLLTFALLPLGAQCHEFPFPLSNAWAESGAADCAAIGGGLGGFSVGLALGPAFSVPSFPELDGGLRRLADETAPRRSRGSRIFGGIFKGFGVGCWVLGGIGIITFAVLSAMSSEISTPYAISLAASGGVGLIGTILFIIGDGMMRPEP